MPRPLGAALEQNTRTDCDRTPWILRSPVSGARSRGAVSGPWSELERTRSSGGVDEARTKSGADVHRSIDGMN